MKNIMGLVFKIVWLGSLIVFLADTDKIIAQSATIQGIVTDQVTGQPLEGANITVQIISANQFRGMASDRNGFYQITGLDAGEYAVRISFVGYIAHGDTLILAENERKTVLIMVALLTCFFTVSCEEEFYPWEENEQYHFSRTGSPQLRFSK